MTQFYKTISLLIDLNTQTTIYNMKSIIILTVCFVLLCHVYAQEDSVLLNKLSISGDQPRGAYISNKKSFLIYFDFFNLTFQFISAKRCDKTGANGNFPGNVVTVAGTNVAGTGATTPLPNIDIRVPQ